jgi:quinol monooxygenase YgiN
MPIFFQVRFRIRAETHAQFEQATRQLSASARKAGLTLRQEWYQDAQNPGDYLSLEAFQDRATLGQYIASGYFQMWKLAIEHSYTTRPISSSLSPVIAFPKSHTCAALYHAVLNLQVDGLKPTAQAVNRLHEWAQHNLPNARIELFQLGGQLAPGQARLALLAGYPDTATAEALVNSPAFADFSSTCKHYSTDLLWLTHVWQPLC